MGDLDAGGPRGNRHPARLSQAEICEQAPVARAVDRPRVAARSRGPARAAGPPLRFRAWTGRTRRRAAGHPPREQAVLLAPGPPPPGSRREERGRPGADRAGGFHEALGSRHIHRSVAVERAGVDETRQMNDRLAAASGRFEVPGFADVAGDELDGLSSRSRGRPESPAFGPARGRPTPASARASGGMPAQKYPLRLSPGRCAASRRRIVLTPGLQRDSIAAHAFGPPKAGVPPHPRLSRPGGGQSRDPRLAARRGIHDRGHARPRRRISSRATSASSGEIPRAIPSRSCVSTCT